MQLFPDDIRVNTPDYISTLSKAEQQALAICGITSTTQLATCCYAALSADLERASEFFPEEMAPLTQERLRSIYQAATGHRPPETAAPTPSSAATDTLPDPTRKGIPSTTLHHKRPNRQQAPLSSLHSKSHSIHCEHPVLIYISALLTPLLYLDYLAWVVVPLLMLVGLLPELNPVMVLGGLLLPPVLYFCICSKATCTICSVHFFTRRGFARNRHAHNWPLLGVPLSTALHILLFLWYRCPACGTPQSLLRRRKRH